MCLGDDTPSIEQCDTPKVAGRRNPIEINKRHDDRLIFASQKGMFETTIARTPEFFSRMLWYIFNSCVVVDKTVL